MTPKRITIIPAIYGKRTADGKVSEPDIHWIIQKWLERHPDIKHPQNDIRAFHGRPATD